MVLRLVGPLIKACTSDYSRGSEEIKELDRDEL